MVTIVLPISRTDFLRPVFECLKNLDKPSDTELLIITDGNEYLQKAVDKRIEGLKFERIRVINFGDTPGEDIDSRRYRISAIHNKAKYYVPDDCEYVLLLEDDTIYPKDTLTKMLNIYKSSNLLDNVAFVQAVQLGRHNAPYIGGWTCDDIENPTEITSVLPQEGITKIDAGGLYCCLVEAFEYKQHTFEPFDKIGKNGLSCDVNLGIYLRQKGYTCYIDWSIQTDHIGDRGSVNLGNTKPVQLKFKKWRDDRWHCLRV